MVTTQPSSQSQPGTKHLTFAPTNLHQLTAKLTAFTIHFWEKGFLLKTILSLILSPHIKIFLLYSIHVCSLRFSTLHVSLTGGILNALRRGFLSLHRTAIWGLDNSMLMEESILGIFLDVSQNPGLCSPDTRSSPTPQVIMDKIISRLC